MPFYHKDFFAYDFLLKTMKYQYHSILLICYESVTKYPLSLNNLLFYYNFWIHGIKKLNKKYLYPNRILFYNLFDSF